MADFNDLQPVVCVTHIDMDGFAAAACVLRKYPHARIYYSNYGKDVPRSAFVRGCKMFVTDFSLQEHEFQLARHNDITLIWIDHHKDNFTMLENKGYSEQGLRTDAHSGAWLTWQYLYPGIEQPEAIKLVDDYDRWIFAYDKTKKFAEGIRLFETRPSMKSCFIWRDLLDDNLELRNSRMRSIVDIGERVLNYTAYRNQIICQDLTFRTEFEGNTYLVANTKQSNSTFFDTADKTGVNAVTMLQFATDIRKYRATIYSPDNKQQVIHLAKRFGGGGHPCAAGCQLVSIPFAPPMTEPEEMQSVLAKYQSILQRRKDSMISQAAAHSDKITLMSLTFRESFLGFTCLCTNYPYITELLRAIPTSVDVIDPGSGLPLKALVGFVLNKSGWYRVGVYFFPVDGAQPSLEEGKTVVPKSFPDARDFFEEKTPYGNVYWFYTRQLPINLPVA